MADGSFLVAFSDAAIDGTTQSIVSQRFDAQFGVVGERQILSTDSLGSQSAVALTVLRGGK